MSTSANIQHLFNTAEEEGTIGANTAALIGAIPDLGMNIAAGLSPAVDGINSSQGTLVTIMPDDSGSLSGSEGLVCDGHNIVLDALAKSKQRDTILMHTRYLNGHVLFPYSPLDQAVRMTHGPSGNYTADKGTPLYDQSIVLLGTVLAQVQDLRDKGCVTRTVTLIITDGEDAHSVRAKAKDVKTIVDDMRRSETNIVAAMGIGDPVKFRKIFRDMGIEDKWILTPGSDPKEIRRAFQMFSQSANAVSQAAPAVFSKLAAGGFGAP